MFAAFLLLWPGFASEDCCGDLKIVVVIVAVKAMLKTKAAIAPTVDRVAKMEIIVSLKPKQLLTTGFKTKSTVDRVAPEKLADVLGRDLVLRIRLFVRFLNI